VYILRVYGAASSNERTYVVPLIDATDNDRFITSDILASGDVKIYSGSGTTWNNLGTLPTWIGNGCYLMVLTQAEQRTNGGMPVISFIDATATAAFSDTLVVVDTIAHSSAVQKGSAGVT